MSSRATPTLPADLENGLKRLKLSTIRRQAADVLLTARTQRWTPEETLRVLVELEVAARDESNMRNRMAAARFPVTKTLAEFNLAESSIPPASHDYLITLDLNRPGFGGGWVIPVAAAAGLGCDGSSPARVRRADGCRWRCAAWWC